jgi:hypothetical protein
LFDFAYLLFSDEASKIHQIIPLPNCWDELLDWTIAATALTAIIQMHQNEQSHQQQQQQSSRRRQNHHDHRVIRFIPFVDSSMIDQVENLPSMSWIELAKFYAESVS